MPPSKCSETVVGYIEAPIEAPSIPRVPLWSRSISMKHFRIADFSERMRTLRPKDVVFVLNALWTSFDALVGLHSVYKVETVGDVYMAVAGCPRLAQNHAVLCCNASIGMMAALTELQSSPLWVDAPSPFCYRIECV